MDPNQALVNAPIGAPPAPGTNSIWSTIQSLVTTATGAVQQIEKTIQSTATAKQSGSAVLTAPVYTAPDWKAWAILALIVVALIAWLK